jgi:sugar phosphate isomerase/epimerase
MIQRRHFLATTLAGLSTAALSPRLSWALDADNPYRKEIGIQLYTLRDAIAADAGKTLQTVADSGYRQVEAYGFPDCDSIIQAAKDAGLPMHSSHFNSDPVVSKDDVGGEAFEKTLQKAKDLGLTHLVIPYLGDQYRKSLDDYKVLCERCNRAAEKAKSAGIQLSYHNHAFEFQPMAGGKSGYDVMIEEFSPDMMFEVDVFWVQVAGLSSVELLQELKGRVSQVHLKDLNASVKTPAYQGVDKEAFEEIGDGVVDIESVIVKSGEIGVKHCHVEQDHSPHPIQSIQQSIAKLKTM